MGKMSESKIGGKHKNEIKKGMQVDGSVAVEKELQNFQNTDGNQLAAPNRDCFSKIFTHCLKRDRKFIQFLKTNLRFSRTGFPGKYRLQNLPISFDNDKNLQLKSSATKHQIRMHFQSRFSIRKA
jgi:hypothetical protein